MYNPDIDFSGLFGKNMSSPEHRMPYDLAWVGGVLNQSDRLQKIFKQYIAGSSASVFSGSKVVGDEVIWRKKVYKCLVNTTDNPEVAPNDWELIFDNFIGIEERSRYCFQKITLEYALNHYFEEELTAGGFVGFKQPDDPISPTLSDIYIDTQAPLYTSFVSFPDDGSASFTDHSSGYVFTTEVIATQTTHIFTVFIPTTVYGFISTNFQTDASLIIRQFLDKYILCGISYIITQY